MPNEHDRIIVKLLSEIHEHPPLWRDPFADKTEIDENWEDLFQKLERTFGLEKLDVAGCGDIASVREKFNNLKKAFRKAIRDKHAGGKPKKTYKWMKQMAFLCEEFGDPLSMDSSLKPLNTSNPSGGEDSVSYSDCVVEKEEFSLNNISMNGIKMQDGATHNDKAGAVPLPTIFDADLNDCPAAKRGIKRMSEASDDTTEVHQQTTVEGRSIHKAPTFDHLDLFGQYVTARLRLYPIHVQEQIQQRIWNVLMNVEHPRLLQ